jgi:SPP1 family predicted phage head-tail adaptor
VANKTAYQLTHKITIQQNTSTTSDAVWADLFTDVWAAKQGLTGRLFYAAAAAQSENDSIFTIHWTKGYTEQIRPTMRILVDGDTSEDHALTITSLPVDVGDEHRWLEIHAKDNRLNAG